ncbi:MAG: FlgD immunoglobulin-like domain containing protein [Candidatus Krumholzibacteriia bacterium]
MHAPSSRSGRGRPGRLTLLLILGLIGLLPVLAAADAWDGRFHTTGIDGIARANLTLGGDLYVGGSIQAAGQVAVGNVARWDGARWHALGSGLNAAVTRLVPLDGDVYACGAFTAAGGLATDHVARWDGHEWHAVGGGLPFVPSAMAVFDGELWCGGWRYDGLAWTEAVTVNGTIRDLTVFDDRLILGGSFTEAGGAPADRVVAWDGGQLVAMPGQPRAVQDLQVVGGELYALGLDVYGEADPVTVWTGATWSAVGDLPPDYMSHYQSLVDQGGQLRLMAAVSPGIPPIWWTDIATWDGADWSWLDHPYDMVDAEHCFVHGGDLLLSGRFSLVDDTIAHGIVRLAAGGPEALGETGLGFGGSWSWTISDICATPDGVAVGGGFDSVGPLVSGAAALWDGGDWRSLDAWNLNIERLAWHEGHLHAFFWAGDVYDANHMVWTGDDWDFLHWSYPDGSPQAAVSWNGRLLGGNHEIVDWSPAGDPEVFAEVAGGEVISLLDWNGALVAGGSFSAVGGVPAAGLALYSGGGWSELGGVDGTVRSLAVHEGDLIVGGTVTTAGGVPVDRVARLSGGVWHPVGDQLSGDVLALASYGGFLYAGGDFTVAGEAGDNLARWDGEAWHVVGGGANHPVHELVVFDGKLHLSGEFGVVGDVPAARFAIWDGTTILSAPVTAVASPLTAAPNPFNPATTVSYALAQAGPARLDVIDMRGRRVRTLVDRWVDAGGHQATWDGRDGRGHRLAAGTYLLRLAAGSTVRTAKVALVE